MRGLKLGFVALLILLLPSVALAAGEVNGRLTGVVTEAQTGSPVPGASVTVSSRALIGGPKTISTSDDGRYEFVELPPGTYDVEVSYAGVKPIRKRVVIRQSEATPLNISWSAELAEAETTVVVEERHMTKPDSTQAGSIISADSESKIAITHRYQVVTAQAAGVVTTAGDSGVFHAIKGANFLMHKFLIDGVDMTDPSSDSWAANIAFDVMASSQILTGGMEAEYNSLGGVINLITAGGSNEWHVDSSFYVNATSFSARAVTGPQFYNGYRQFDTSPTPPNNAYQANLNLSGPIVKNKLWFNISGEYRYETLSVPAGPPLNIQHPAYFRHQFLGHLKLTWAPTSKDRINLTVNADPARLYNEDSRYTNNANFERGIAESGRDQYGAHGILQWDHFFSQNINTALYAGFLWSVINDGAQGTVINYNNYGPGCPNPANPNDPNCNYNPNQPQHNNTFDNTIWYQGITQTDDTRYQFTFDPSISMRGRLAGSHDSKIGVQFKWMKDNYFVHVPGGIVYTDGGGPNVSANQNLEKGLCDEMAGMAGHSDANCFQRTLTPDFTARSTGVGVGLFIQDRWKPTSWLTVVPGIRFDYGWTQDTFGETVSSLFGVGPRLGGIFDITRDQKTIFSVYYGRANQTLTLLPAVTIGQGAAQSTTQQWNPMTQSWNLLFNSGGPSGHLIGNDIKTPHTDEFLTSIRRELFQNSVFEIDYTYKRISNIWDGVEVNQIWDPTGYKVRGYANGTPQQVFMYTTPDGNFRTYQGVDFILESRPNPHWDIWAAYTLSWLYGPGQEELGQLAGEVGNSAFYNPKQNHFYTGFLPDDHRHALKMRISYAYGGFTIGANMTYLTGAPRSKKFFEGNDGAYANLRAPLGNDPGTNGTNDYQKWSELRLPDTMSVDARVAYDFYALIHAHVSLLFDFFNLFDLMQPTEMRVNDTSTYGTFSHRQIPFAFQLGARYIY
jgi:hypothetical protein